MQEPNAVLGRRAFLTIAAAVGGGMLVGGAVGASRESAGAQSDAQRFQPNAWIRMLPDDSVTLVMGYVEMGQGTYTSIPMLIAEELEIDLTAVKLEHAPADDKLYRNPLLGFQVTGGSTTTRASYRPLREMGAAARIVLIQAAAQRWGADASACRAERGTVVHPASGRRLRYGELVADAARLPVPDVVPLKPASQFKLIGQPAKRLDTPDKVTGAAKYGIDVRLPGLKVATLVQSPVVGGRVRRVDAAAALRVRGVTQVVQVQDAVAVVAEHMGAARKGLAALVVEWDDGVHVGLSTADIVASMKAASAEGGVVVRRDGDADVALKGAIKRLDAVYEVPFLIHAAMEPLNCTVHVRPDSCEVWLGTQVITRAQATAAQVCGLPLHKVTVHNHLLGGGFGRRLEVDSVEKAVGIARHVAGPVKIIWSREEDCRHDMYRPYFYDVLSAGIGADGSPVAWRHRITGSSILKRWAPPLYKNGFDNETIDGAVAPPYALPNMQVEYRNHEPPIPTAFWRGVGPTHNIFVVESFMDELANAAHADPVAYRLALLSKNPRAANVLKIASARAGWGEPLPSRCGRGVSLQLAFGTYLATVCEVEVDSSGDVKVRRVVCAIDTGVVINPDTVVAQIQGGVIFGISATLWGEATISRGRIQQSNFHDMRVVRMSEAPPIDVEIVRSGEAPGGVGEPGTSGLAPALTNAIFAATGKRLRKLPVDSGALATG